MEKPLAVASHLHFDAVLDDLFTTLVAAPRRKEAVQRHRTPLTETVQEYTKDLPTVRRLIRQSVSVTNDPELFGLRRGDVEFERANSVEPFEVLLPNHTRVVALRAFVASPHTDLSNFLRRQKHLESTRNFFQTSSPSKQVITGAIVLPSTAPHHFPEGPSLLAESLTSFVDGFGNRRAVFNMVDPMDRDELERVAKSLV